MSHDHPNIVLIVLDTARADAIAPYGADAGQTPHLAALAARGVAPDAYATASWTVPSHTSMLSGLLPRTAGLLQAPGGDPAGVAPQIRALEDRWLPSVLARSGYSTAALSANLWLTPQTGFDTGFKEFCEITSTRPADIPMQGARGKARWMAEALRAQADDGAGEAARVLEGWTRSQPSKPFFWFVNLLECHSPYMPPRRFNELGPIDRLRAASEAGRHLNLDSIWRANVGGFDVPDAAIARMRALYRGAIRMLDEWVGGLVDSLERAGLIEETLLVVTSDHGENLGEGGRLGHAFSLDDRLIRVPLICAGPGAATVAGAGRGVLSLADLPEMLATAAGLESHPWPSREARDGIAVAQFDGPAPADDPRVIESAARWGLGPEAARRFGERLDCATDGRWKLLVRDGVEELYDLRADGLELDPLDPADAAEAPLQRLRAALAAAESERRHQGHDLTEAPAATRAEVDAADIEARMRQLGYL